MISLTDDAVQKVTEFMDAQEREGLALRISVGAGGCSGFSYGMALDAPREDDQKFVFGPITVVIDPESAPLLDGIEVDYVNSLMGGGFSINNPNAVASCGCGNSFRTKDDPGAAQACSH